MQVRSNRLHRPGNVAQVRLVILVQRRGHANNDGVHLPNLAVVGRSPEAGLLRLLNHLRQNAHNVAAARVQRLNLVQRDIKTCHAKTLLAEKQSQRQTDVAHAHNAHTGLAAFDLFLEVGEGTCNDRIHSPDCKVDRPRRKLTRLGECMTSVLPAQEPRRVCFGGWLGVRAKSPNARLLMYRHRREQGTHRLRKYSTNMVL